MSDSRLLIVFVKAPRPGSVKTRLAQSVGPESACLIYQILVRRLLHHLEPVSTLQLRFSPDHEEKYIRPWRRRNWTLAPQGPGDLGRRLRRAFSESFAAGFTRIAVIGSDSPEITPNDIQNAWAALDSHDMVLGPTKDGGYWLIALSRTISGRKLGQLFNGIPWSTADVFAETVEHARAAGLDVHSLREMQDIDTEQDWKAYLRRNAFAQIQPTS